MSARGVLRKGLPLAAVALTMAMACGGGGGGGGGSSSARCSSSAGTRWSASEIEARTSPYKVQPVYDVPKGLQNCTVGFINPGKSVPFFQTWSTAMHDAARLYGVTLVEDDVNFKYETEATSFQQMNVRNLDAVGTLPGNPALLAATQAAKVPLITVDSTVAGNPYSLGVPNEKVGSTAGDMLAKAARDKLSGAWSGRSLVYVGLSAGNCPPCDARVQSGLAAVREVMSVPDSNVVVSEKAGDVTGTQSIMTDILTAHPNSVFIVLPLNDETGVGAIHALDAAHRLGDAVTITLGADKLGRDALRTSTYDGTLLGAIDFNPYAEGWDFVAAAVATVRGDKYQPYDVRTFLTSGNVNQHYPLPDNRA